MNAYFTASNLSNEEKENILSQHRTIYDGYRTLQPNVNNTQPLYVQDFAKDKVGAVVNNKGIAKPYTNVGINEQYFNNIGEKAPLPKKATRELSKIIDEGQGVCECGGEMYEGECMECGWKGEVGAMEEEFDYDTEFYDEDMEVDDQVSSFDTEGNFLGVVKQNPDMEIEKPKFNSGSDLEKFEGMMEATGKLSDIYNVEDLGDSDFDYVQGGGNDYGTFEKMHHMKDIKNEQIEDDFEDPDNEDDGFEDLQADGGEMYEQGYTGGGNAPDMDISNIKPAYDFVSDGPGDVYPTEEEMEESAELYTDKFDEEKEYETMESAWSDEMEEANDISGVQGIYGDMEPAFDFDSEGPGSAGPYQTSSWGEEQYLPKHVLKKAMRQKDAEKSGEEFDDSELDMSDYEDYGDMKDKSWEEITSITGDDEFSNIDEDIRESFLQQKNKITEMFVRMKRF